MSSCGSRHPRPMDAGSWSCAPRTWRPSPARRSGGGSIRYAHAERSRPLDAYQTVFALHPGSAEMPSAAAPFTTRLVTGLVARGVLVAPLTLHTGVSSLERGEDPYPERYEVPPTTAWLVNAVHAHGGRVIAVGTTVVRALETVAAPNGAVRPDEGSTDLVLTPQRGLRTVDGLLAGWHEPESSHLRLLETSAGAELLERSYAAAQAAATAGTSSATATSSCPDRPLRSQGRQRPRPGRRPRCSPR